MENQKNVSSGLKNVSEGSMVYLSKELTESEWRFCRVCE